MANGVTRKDLKTATRLFKDYFKSQKYPFEFSLEGWKDEDVVENTNCYRYAFNMQWRDDDRRVMAFLGWSYGKLHEHVTGPAAFGRFEIDLKRMGFKFQETTDAKSLPKRGYKIALFVYESDFHFARQNADGSWSHKEGFGAEVELLTDEDGNLITPYELKQNQECELKIYNVWQ